MQNNPDPVTQNVQTVRPEPQKAEREVELDIESLESGGRGVGRIDGKVFFVRGALPQQRVRARISQEKKHFAEGYAVKICSPAPDELPAPCAHADTCGGCPLQRLPYVQQLAWKQRFVEDALTRIGHLDCPVHEPVPAPAPWFYRNKMEFAFAHDAQGALYLGLRQPQSHEVCAVPHCRLQTRKTAFFVDRIIHAARDLRIPAYNPQTRQGFLRYAVIRELPNQTVSIGLILSPHPKSRELGYALVEALKDTPECVQIEVSSRKAHENVAYGEHRVFFHGVESLLMDLEPLQFSLGTGSFFQVNTSACVLLYDIAVKYAALQAHESMWDLYGGVGSLGLWVGRECAGLSCVEQAQDSAQNALKNYQRWVGKPENGHVLQGNVASSIQNLAKADLVILDPPRAGVEAQVLDQLCQCRTPRMVYVSCNPVSLARDLALLNRAYDVLDVQPVDMFPQTAHIECVARLALKK